MLANVIISEKFWRVNRFISKIKVRSKAVYSFRRALDTFPKGLNEYNFSSKSLQIKGFNFVFDILRQILGGIVITLIIGSESSLGGR